MTFDPRTNLGCLALQLAVEAGGLPWQDSAWAVRGVLDEEGTAHLHPLYPADIPAFVEASWEAELPSPYLWSVKP